MTLQDILYKNKAKQVLDILNYSEKSNEPLIDPRLIDKLIYDEVPSPVNIYHQGQYSSNMSAINASGVFDIQYPSGDKRPPLKDLNDMQERDPVVQQCMSFKALRSVQSFGNYSHPKKEIESYVNANLQTLPKSFKRILFKMVSSVLLYGFCMAEFTFSSKIKGYQGEWRLGNINVLNPEKIQSLTAVNGKIHFIKYDNGNGKIIDIPYRKCLHIINNCGATFDEQELWGIGDGLGALNYYKLKRVVLTQLALATKNNSTGLIHAKTPNTGRTILVDSKMNPLKDSSGKPIETTKQIALNYQLQDLYKKDYIVTDSDVDIQRIQITNDERFWQYILDYIDKAIQKSFGVPTGIFDAGMSGIQNVGLSKNFKSVFDATVFGLTDLLKEELLNKIVKKLLAFNFPFDFFKNNYGDFVFEPEEDQETINSRLSTISSLIASGILQQNDTEVLALIKKSLGLPALDEEEKAAKAADEMNAKIQKEVQTQLEQLQAQMQMLQTQQQIDMIQNPPPPPVDPAADPNAVPTEEAAPETQPTEDYPAGA